MGSRAYVFTVYRFEVCQCGDIGHIDISDVLMFLADLKSQDGRQVVKRLPASGPK